MANQKGRDPVRAAAAWASAIDLPFNDEDTRWLY